MQSMTAVNKQRSIGSIQFLPVNLFASVMGISGLSLAWREANQLWGTSTVIADAIGILAIVIFIVLSISYLLKWVLYPQQVKNEFSHPVLGNFFGTITIAILLLSSVIGSYSQAAGQVIWGIGTVLALVLSLVFVSRLLNGNHKPENMVPALLVPVVGTLDISVAGGQMPFPWAHEVNLLSLAIGGFVALVYFTLILSRLIQHAPMPAGLVPSMIIMIAPFEVGFLGYTNFEQRVDSFASILFYFGLFLFLVLFFKVFKKTIPFGASWWGVSFPMAALSNAALKYALYADSWPLTAIAVIVLALLSAVLLVLFIRTLNILFNGKLLKG
ncbi:MULTISPECIES: SLAC1 anion channel family protein [unclassified Paenibacillus]|uniref:SLAC1 anion channel family protein n=1 Tax=unclassified Paenibacillus TaxID=185978 RepID=UPI0010498C13|nr:MULTISPECIES: SLAC1 anion channel family protein [unclassified Paenibacillus]NIK71634.1 tellurite resistance protein [Paenibacillus sp. BK720]TCM96283.1 tellurite resistance protein [Paenibacillus sp. BK033]